MILTDSQFINSVVGTKYCVTNTSGFNCWGLVAYYYASRSIKLNDYKIDKVDVRDICTAFTRAFTDNSHGFKRTDKIKNGDVIVYKSRTQMHCGLYFDNKLLHSSPSTGGVVYQSLSLIGFDNMEYWTYGNN